MYPIFNRKALRSPEGNSQSHPLKKQKTNHPRSVKLGDVSDDFEKAMIESKSYANVKQYHTGEPGVLQFLVAVDRKGFQDLLPVLQDLTRARPHKFALEHDQWKLISKALIPIGLHLERLCSKYGVNEKDRKRYWGELGTFWPAEAQDADWMINHYRAAISSAEGAKTQA